MIEIEKNLYDNEFVKREELCLLNIGGVIVGKIYMQYRGNL